jgi:hypothetical protein
MEDHESIDYFLSLRQALIRGLGKYVNGTSS